MAFPYICLVVLNALIWGFNSSVVKLGVQAINPLLYTAWRYILILPLLFFIPRPQTSWKNIIWANVATCSVTTLAATVMYLGVGAGISTVVVQTQVFLTALLAFILWRERPSRNSWIGMSVAFIGVSLIALRLGSQVSYLGIILMFITALCWAGMNVIFRQVRGVNMFHLIVWGSLILPLPLLLLSMIFFGPTSVLQNPIDFSLTTIFSLFYSGFISGLAGNICVGTLLKHYPATTVAPFMMLVPVAGLFFAYILLNETLTWLSASGCALVFIGLALNQWKQKEKAARTSMEIED